MFQKMESIDLGPTASRAVTRGARVCLSGLDGASHLNGRMGIAEAWNYNRGRWEVRLEENLDGSDDDEENLDGSGQVIAAKPGRLQVQQSRICQKCELLRG